jgi:hypothetical protein
MTRILLLDADGVMVQPAGYRAALRSTVNYFIDTPLALEEDSLAELERRQITSEWDMAPLLIAAYWNDILGRQSMPDLPTDVNSAAREIKRRRKVNAPTHVIIPDFHLQQGKYPARSAYEAECFPYLLGELRMDLLTGSRSVQKSPTTRIVQHYTLGSKHFEETYNLPAEVETESLLLKYDRSPITDEVRVKLRQEGNHLVGFTNRPSGPPREMGHGMDGYPPEAEFALELAGLEDIPMIAHGRLKYLASQHDLDAATLEKPSPFHALAAVLAAWTGDELTALQAANHWYETQSLNGKFVSLPRTFELIVVEDTLGGVRSVLAAGEILKASGFNVTVRPFGLTLGNDTKASAFQKANVPYYSDWESIMEVIG